MNSKKVKLRDELTHQSIAVFENLHCLHTPRPQSHLYSEDRNIDDEVVNLDEDKMMAHILDCVAALAEKQRVQVALKKPLVLSVDGEVQELGSEQQAARNKVFQAALALLAGGLTHDGAAEDERSEAVRQLALVFPDDDKLTDGRGWLPLHWAVVAAAGEQHGVTAADVETVYSTDPLALRRHHSDGSRRMYSDINEIGATPAHLLCMQEMTERTQGLVRFFSMAGPQSFTMNVRYCSFNGDDYVGDNFGALHVACAFGQPTEWLLQQLLQLDSSACRVESCDDRMPLGWLCMCSAGRVNEQALRCLLAADSSAAVVHNGVRGCLESKLLTNRLEAVTLLLEVNPQAAYHADSYELTLARITCRESEHMSAQECIDVLKLLLAANKDAFQAARGDDGRFPVHELACYGPLEVLEYLLQACPEVPATTLSTESKENLLHCVARGCGDRVAKARLLCARYPAMMLQRDRNGRTPLHTAIPFQKADVLSLLYAAGGRELVSAPVVHPTDPNHVHNGWLPLHRMFYHPCYVEEGEFLLSPRADTFRLLLRLYPEAAGIEAGEGQEKKTPYQLAVDKGFPAYCRRLLLRAAPHLDPSELRRLNWEARRQAMFLAFRALGKTTPLLARLRYENKDLVKHVVSFL